MTEKLHWRKTAKICGKCNQLRSIKQYLLGKENCVRCEWNEELERFYKQCPYCRNFFNIQDLPGTLCEACKKIARDKHSLFKKHPKLTKGIKYQCTLCKIDRSPFSYKRGSDTENLICKKCEGEKKLHSEGKFRCFHCGGSCPLSEKGWSKGNGYYNCLRCTEKERERNKIWAREWRKLPSTKEYYKQYSRYYWHNIVKPLYNKNFALQWGAGLLKPRRRNLSEGWYVLNRSLFDDFKNRPQYWYGITMKVIKIMKEGKDVAERLERIAGLKRPPPPMF